MEEKYKIVITGSGISIEREIDSQIITKIMHLVMSPNSNQSMEIQPQIEVQKRVGINDGIGAREFLAQKSPRSDTERTACLAYYLTKFRNTSQFKTIDITRLNTEAAQPKLANASYTARNAVDQQYLALAGAGKKQITIRGEALVEALPDRNVVRDALEKNPLRRKKKQTKK